jgi:hypothetical protein
MYCQVYCHVTAARQPLMIEKIEVAGQDELYGSVIINYGNICCKIVNLTGRLNRRHQPL